MAAPRAIQSLTISFGLVAIPVKLYTAASSLTVRFNMLSRASKVRVKQQLIDPGTDERVERKDTVKGYEYMKGHYVIFEEDELKKLEAAKSSSLDISEFVPQGSVDPLYFEKGYFLGPDKGGHKPYRLLTETMLRNGCCAVGQFAARGKEQLSILRPHGPGLMLHQLYYADEVRSFEDLDLGEGIAFRPGEEELADQLVNQLTSDVFDPTSYRDEFRERVLAAVEKKVAGEEVALDVAQPKAEIIDLFDALKASLSTDEAVEGAPGKAKGVKKVEPKGKRPVRAKGPKKAEPTSATQRRSRKKKSESA